MYAPPSIGADVYVSNGHKWFFTPKVLIFSLRVGPLEDPVCPSLLPARAPRHPHSGVHRRRDPIPRHPPATSLPHRHDGGVPLQGAAFLWVSRGLQGGSSPYAAPGAAVYPAVISNEGTGESAFAKLFSWEGTKVTLRRAFEHQSGKRLCGCRM